MHQRWHETQWERISHQPENTWTEVSNIFFIHLINNKSPCRRPQLFEQLDLHTGGVVRRSTTSRTSLICHFKWITQHHCLMMNVSNPVIWRYTSIYDVFISGITNVLCEGFFFFVTTVSQILTSHHVLPGATFSGVHFKAVTNRVKSPWVYVALAVTTEPLSEDWNICESVTWKLSMRAGQLIKDLFQGWYIKVMLLWRHFDNRSPRLIAEVMEKKTDRAVI